MKSRGEMKQDQGNSEGAAAGNLERRPRLSSVIVICGLSAVTLFGIYEIVERIWLASLAPEVLHLLHILRGLAAAAIVGVLAILVLFRQLETGTADLPPVPPLWARRLQHVSLRTKIVVPMVALAVIPALVIGLFAMFQGGKTLRRNAIERLRFDTATKGEAIQAFLDRVQQDLHFLSRLKSVCDLASMVPNDDAEASEFQRRTVEEEFQNFSERKRGIYQIRYLDEKGREVIRLNVKDGQAYLVARDGLQDKGGRYYVKECLKLPEDAIYVSPMDLNVEHGKLEEPHQNVVRYGTRVFAERGEAKGILIINLYADYLLSLIEPMPGSSEAWLLDENGFYLGHLGEQGGKRMLYDPEKRRRIDDDYPKKEAEQILDADAEGATIETLSAFLSCVPVAYDSGKKDRRWMLMVAYPRGPIEAHVSQLAVFLLAVMVLVLSVSGLMGVFIGQYLARPLSSLRLATREISAGNLFRRVQVTTSDEIEGLAEDFNTMTERLRLAHAELASWNEKLEREVARQTEDLHRLQSGMARVDKLASIGQMTASVMHEIGNPLASIKANIEDAEEGEELCQECQAVLTLVLKEVDRLTTFLRTFSRLANLRESRMENVSLAEVVESVVTLVAAQVRRRGLSFQVTWTTDILRIRGDADQLRQLLINLILNSVEASADGEAVLVQIRRAPEPSPAGSALIEVVDHGEGIPAQNFDKIWDPFFTTKPEGTGLGLCICRQIVNDHGGTIQVRSHVGKGTVVTVTFPCHEADAGANP